MTPPAPRRLVVGVLTFRRPDLLALMLPGVVEQARHCAHPTEVLVVDNDPACSAEDVTRAAAGVAAEVGVTVAYAAEPVPGIVAGRNRALDEAAGRGADALVFVDDDEQVEPGWLDALVHEWLRSGADAVAGPTIWPGDLDLAPWVEASGFYRRRARRPTGTVLSSFAAGNLLLDLGSVRRHGLRFDARFSATGGEDTALARTLIAAGGVVRWCDEAVTVEAVPPERRTRAFVLQRVRNRASTWVQVVLATTPGAGRRRWRRADLLVRAGWRALAAVVSWVGAALRRDLARRARAERRLAATAGMAAGLVGRRYEEYAGADTTEPG